ncbi:MAG: NACHT domain-containing protein [Candidatus Thiodiazotropha taylori]
MYEEILGGAAEGFSSEIVKGLSDLLGIAKQEVESLLGRRVNDYLERKYNDNKYTRTVLRGIEKVYFYEVYYPLIVEYNGSPVVKDGLERFLDNNRAVAVIGEAGSGKSMLVKHLFLREIKKGKRVPIIVELRHLNQSNRGLRARAFVEIFGEGTIAEREIFERMLKKGAFVFFLDGYDELARDETNVFSKEIVDFISNNGENKFLVTSRPYAGAAHLNPFLPVSIAKLSKEDGEIEEFVDCQLRDEDELSHEIKKSIKNNTLDYVDNFFANPLLLSLFILTYQSNSTIPKKRSQFYRRVLNALFSEHDSKTKIGWSRTQRSGLSQDEYEEILQIFSALSYLENKFSFHREDVVDFFKSVRDKASIPKVNPSDFIYDMMVSTSIWVEDSGNYSFSHRSIQEYFCAAFIASLSETNKEKIYGKIAPTLLVDASNYGKGRRVSEYNNLIDLCNEVDPVGFRRYFDLPILNHMRKKLESETTVGAALVTMLYQGMTIKLVQEKDKIELVGYDLSRNDLADIFSRYAHKGFKLIEEKLATADLQKDLKSFIDKTCRMPTKARQEMHVYFSSNEDVLFLLCNKIFSGGRVYAEMELFDSIQNQIDVANMYINGIEESRSSIIDMIE